jgi:hypothetical protein
MGLLYLCFALCFHNWLIKSLMYSMYKFYLNTVCINLCLSICLTVCSTREDVCVKSRDNLNVKFDHRVRNFSAFTDTESLSQSVFKNTSNHSDAPILHFVISQFHFVVIRLFLFSASKMRVRLLPVVNF